MNVQIRSPYIHLFGRENRLSTLRRYVYGNFFRPGILIVAAATTFSGFYASRAVYRARAWTHHSSNGLTGAQQAGRKMLRISCSKALDMKAGVLLDLVTVTCTWVVGFGDKSLMILRSSQAS